MVIKDLDNNLIQSIFKNNCSKFYKHQLKAEIARRYYRGQNDILNLPRRKDAYNVRGYDSPIRQAENRVPFNFHGLLVNQKASYLFTYPPLFDTKDKELNIYITQVLGDSYAKKCKDLCVEASNTGTAWLHYWEENGVFKYGTIPSTQILPVYDSSLEQELQAVFHIYRKVETDGVYMIYEYWDKECCTVYRTKEGTGATEFIDYPIFTDELIGEPTNQIRHGFDRVPFIQFNNNNLGTSDLENIKALIDAYDKTYSGFVDDLEDIQQTILVLTNYGGMDPDEDIPNMLHDMKYYKVISLDNDGGGDKSGVSTLTIDIPVEARDKLLDMTRKAIFDIGQGIDPQQQGFDNTSGEAMKFLYSLLELKAGLMETEFRLGLGQLIRAICRFKGKNNVEQIIQTWTRNAIRSEAEVAQICSQSMGIISHKTIIKNHPLVEDAELEEHQLAEEQKRNGGDIYSDYAFHHDHEKTTEGGEQ